MSEETKVDKDYLEAFNYAYLVAKELDLKPEGLTGINPKDMRAQGLKDGIEQYHKDFELKKEKNKAKNVIKPLDLDNFDDGYIDLTSYEKDKDKDKDVEL